MRLLALASGLVFAVTTGARAESDARAEAEAALVAPSAADAGQAHRRAEIERSLVELRDEEGSTPRLWPIATIALGATAVLAAATSGAISALTCDDSCSAGAWQGPTVVGGSLVTVLGILWLRATDADLREVADRRRRLEAERDRIEPASADRAQEHAGPRVTLAVRGAF